MAYFQNAEIRQGGQVVRTNVNVEVHSCVPVTGPSAAKVEWNGVLRPPNNIGLVVGETYILALPGFPPAKIRITSEANAVDSSVTFTGVDEIPISVPSEQVQSAS